MMGVFSTILPSLKRSFSTIKVDNKPLANYQVFNPALRATIQQLDSIAPRFELGANQIDILTHPKVFYDTLKEKILKAKSRIFLSSLYIGKGQADLIDTLSLALQNEPKLKVEILIDCLRSTRDMPKASTASLLATLVKKYGKDRVDVRLFHTPLLHGWQAKLVPQRFNEIYGLQHMKIYGIDSEVMLSGANLSQDYFVNRQDRYWVFKEEALANYYHKLQKTVGKLSYQLHHSNNKMGFYLDWPTSNLSSEPHINTKTFIRDATRHLVPILKSKEHTETTLGAADIKTIVYPVSSFVPLLKPDQSTELQAVNRVLALLDEKEARFTLTAGYFNVFPSIWNRITHSRCPGDVIVASPESNSFYKSRGVSGYLPEAYVYISQLFLKDLLTNDGQIPHKTGVMKCLDWADQTYKNISKAFYPQTEVKDPAKPQTVSSETSKKPVIDKPLRVKLLEWRNGTVNQPNGWSYHAKGIWVNLPNESTPSVSVVGSSQYTQRAYGLDLETNAIVITIDQQLKNDMQAEIDNLKMHTRELGLKDYEKRGERKTSLGVQMATKILTKMM